MDKIKLNQHFENYGNVKNALKRFVHVIVWESINVCEGCKEEEVNERIDKFCNAYENVEIFNMLNKVATFIKSLEARYEVHCYEIDENGNCDEKTAKHYNTDNEVTALKKAAEFYRNAKCPQVNIYDNEQNKYIAEWH